MKVYVSRCDVSNDDDDSDDDEKEEGDVRAMISESMRSNGVNVITPTFQSGLDMLSSAQA